MESPAADIRAEDLFQVLGQVESAIIVVDRQGNVLFCNQKYVETCKYDTLGMKAEQIVGMSMKDLLSLGGLEYRQSAALLALEQKKKVRAIFQAPLYKLVMSTAIPAFDRAGNVKFVFTTVQDESEIFRLSATSNEVREMYYQ